MNKKIIGLGFLIVMLGIAGCSAANEAAAEITSEPATLAAPTIVEDSTQPPQATDGPIVLNERSDRDYSQYEIITLLAPDGIPAIDNPQFLTGDAADAEYAPDELILGVSYDGDSRAYSVSLLSSHEIVNDTVGGRPISVTW